MATKNKITVRLICMAVIFHMVHSSAIIKRDFVNQIEEALTDHERKQQSIDDYYKARSKLLNKEIYSSLGGDIRLNYKEKIANKIIMEAKEKEINTGLINPYKFNPSRHIFEVLDTVNQSKVFQIIQKMPKGAILHSHDTYINTADYAVSLAYWPNLWQRTLNNSDIVEEFRFSREEPANSNVNDTNGDSTWRLVEDVRNEMGASKYDEHIRKIFTLFDKNIHPKIQYKDIDDVWVRFYDINTKFYPIVTFAPIWKIYYKNALKEMLNDGVQYLELRGGLPKV